MGVEKIFPLFSPMIDNIEIIKRGKTRRSKIYYVRDKAAKEISKRMRMIMMSIGLSDEEAKTKPAEDNTVVEENVTPTEEVAPATEDTSSETISDIAPETTSEDSDEGEKIEEKESEKTEDKKEETK
jgi:large subunit ribosomal protein L19